MTEIEKSVIKEGEEQCREMQQRCEDFRCVLDGVANVDAIFEDDDKWRKCLKLYSDIEDVEGAISEMKLILQDKLECIKGQEEQK